MSDSKDRFTQVGDMLGVLMFAVLGAWLAARHNTDAAVLCICILYMVGVDQVRLRKIHLLEEKVEIAKDPIRSRQWNEKEFDEMLAKMSDYSTKKQTEDRKAKLKDYDFMEGK